jgi:hypothetical protein
LAVLEFELRAYHEADALPYEPALFGFRYFTSSISCFCSEPASDYTWPLAYLGSQASTLYPTYWLKWGFANFLPGLAMSHDPPNLHLCGS